MISLLRWLAVLVVIQGLTLEVTRPMDMIGKQLPRVVDFVVTKPKDKKQIVNNSTELQVSFPRASNKIQDILSVVIQHSHNNVGVQPTVYLDIDSNYTAYYIGSTNSIMIRDPQIDLTLNNIDINNIDWYDGHQLWSVVVLGHEYGHHIQHMFNKPYDETEADTFGSYVALKLGCPPAVLKQYYLDLAQELDDSGAGDQSNIGHPDVVKEMRDSAANVDHVDELLATYI